MVAREIEGVGTGEGSDMVEPYVAETEYRIAGSVGFGDVNAPGFERTLQAVRACLLILGKERLQFRGQG